jgi:general secretion pathway protein A
VIQIALIGQPELKYKLQQKKLEQFAQRVTVHCHLDALKEEEVAQYIRYRLEVGGAANGGLFEKSAIDAVARYSGGIPRLINILCDAALVYGYADELKVIEEGVIDEAVKARAAGGIFPECYQDRTSEPTLAEAEDKTVEEREDRLQSLQRRIRSLENVVGSLDQRLSALNQKRDERDTVVLELFKMLKDSLECRSDMLSILEKKYGKNDAKERTPATPLGLRRTSQ